METHPDRNANLPHFAAARSQNHRPTSFPAVAFQQSARHCPLRPTIPQVIDKSLNCGTLERGFARIRCDNCGLNALLAFSCKSRGFCPSCHQKNV